MKRILITGVAGFIGRIVARYFTQRGWEVFGIDCISNENAPLADLKEYAALTLPHPHLGELLDAWRPDVCVHAAGRASVSESMQDPSSDFINGPVLTFNLLDAIRRNAPKCGFIFISSAAVYGNPVSLPVSETHSLSPISVYGYHKWQSEILCGEFSSLFGLKTASVRIFSAYGPGLRRQVIWDIFEKVLTHKVLTLQGTGEESRDFIHVFDIAKGLEAVAASALMQGEVYNLGSGREVKISELVAKILQSLGSDLTPEFNNQVPAGVPLKWCADISKIRSLGFIPSVPFEQGIEIVKEWCSAELKAP